MRQKRLTNDQCFDNYIVNLKFKLFDVCALIFKDAEQSTQAPFVSNFPFT